MMKKIPDSIFFLAVRFVACMATSEKTFGAKKEFLRLESENILLQLSLLEILVTPYSIPDTTAELNVPGTYRFTGGNLAFEVFCNSLEVKNAINTLISE
ncbi:hypothetical protein [Sodalis sp. dw_96]|uniref:hypothetical protein n=1 Tax=Sodalis sp. dw_96 TaxID=2719794 RepID=UPI001BD24009|nr:hypothetical protein [Sodalis sp. dw_96]